MDPVRSQYIVVLVIVITIYWFIFNKPTKILYREPYQANSIININNIIKKPGLFYILTRFEIDIWIKCIAEPLSFKVLYNRDYERYNDLDNLDIYFKRLRKSQLNVIQRLFRWNCIMGGISFNVMAWGSDQHISTITRDFHHITTLVLHQLHGKYLYAPHPSSWDYGVLKGNGDFATFPNVVYAADVVKIPIRRYVSSHDTSIESILY